VFDYSVDVELVDIGVLSGGVMIMIICKLFVDGLFDFVCIFVGEMFDVMCVDYWGLFEIDGMCCGMIVVEIYGILVWFIGMMVMCFELGGMVEDVEGDLKVFVLFVGGKIE